MTLFKKTLLTLNLIGLGLMNFAYAIVPSYEPDAQPTAYFYAVDQVDLPPREFHAFLSNGDYCYLKTAQGVTSARSGSWQKAGKNIRLTLAKPENQISVFGIWDDDTDKPFDNIALNEFLADGDDQPFLLGFGTDKPTKLALYDPKIHAKEQPIPKGATHVFVGKNSQDKDGYTLTALSLENLDKIPQILKRHGQQRANKLQLTLIAIPDAFAKNPVLSKPNQSTIRIQDNTLKINGTITQGELLKAQTDINKLKNLCSPQKTAQPFIDTFISSLGEPTSPMFNEIREHLIPKMHQIHYQGKLDKGTWLQK